MDSNNTTECLLHAGYYADFFTAVPQVVMLIFPVLNIRKLRQRNA